MHLHLHWHLAFDIGIGIGIGICVDLLNIFRSLFCVCVLVLIHGSVCCMVYALESTLLLRLCVGLFVFCVVSWCVVLCCT